MENTLLVSSGMADITPHQRVMLGGYESRTSTLTGIADRLEANALVFKGPDSRVVIVSTDLLYAGGALRARLLHDLDLEERPDELFLCASHTHFAPMTAEAMPRLGIVDDHYVGFVSARIVELIRSIEQKGVPCICTYNEGAANHSMSRRLVHPKMTRSGLMKLAVLAPNPAGERDESVRVVKLTTPGGHPLAIVWNYACHPVGFPRIHQVSADYPGRIRVRLRQEFGDIPIVFMQGFSGDVRPSFAGLPHEIRGLARRLFLGPQFRKPRWREWKRWCESLADTVASLARRAEGEVQLRPPIVKRIEVPEHLYAVGGDGDKPLFWHLIDCGGFRIVGINAEPVVAYRRLIAKYFADAPFLTVGCLGDTHCYLPSDAMISEGGYEVEGFRPLLGFSGRFRDGVQAPVVQTLKELLI